MLAVLVAVFILAIGIGGCSSNGVAANEVLIWAITGSDNAAWLTEMEREFEAENSDIGIVVRATFAEYNSILTNFARGNSPDIVYVDDEYFKRYADGGFIAPLDDLIEEYWADSELVDVSEIWEPALARYRYEVSNNTSDADDPLYCIPKDMDPTVLYYNEGAFEELGITVISVDEEDLVAWNADKIADANGKKKSDYEALAGVGNVPARGYWRSDGNWVSGTTWRAPESSATLVFNNRIPMSWDEVEDLAMLCTDSYNPGVSPTTYGYYTEWWFNYGWSVGGDCLNDLTGSGEWNFSLLDPNPNYVVMDGTFTGRTGTVYNEGETISFIDKMNILSVDGKDEVLVPDDYGDYYHADKSLGKAGIWEGIQAGLDAGVLSQLPSTRDAFSRYLKLGAKSNAVIDGENGLDISPNPSTFSARTSMNYFFSGNLAILAQSSVYMADLSEEAKARGFSWDIAPLVVYKEYEDPSDPDCDTVKAQGKQAGHSNSLSMVVRTGSEKKDDAVRFMMWMASEEGQRIRASIGFFPNQKSLLPEVEFKKGVAPGNVRVFSEALEFQGPGDWWYMPDHVWVEKWCVDLNAEVRNGLMTYEEWYSPAIKRTNEWLQQYKKYSR